MFCILFESEPFFPQQVYDVLSSVWVSNDGEVACVRNIYPKKLSK